MQDDRFTSFEEINHLVGSRKIVFFGGGAQVIKTKRKLDYRNPEYLGITDNDPNLHGTEQYGLKVLNPDILVPYVNQKAVLIIICTTSFQEVSRQLQDMGFKSGIDFIVSPILNDLRIISEMENVKAKMLFTCGATSEDNPKYGGGIYELTLNGYEWDYRKVHSGRCYGLWKHQDSFVVMDHEAGILKFDYEYNVIATNEMPEASRCHGVAYDSETEKYFIVASYLDCILVYDKQFELQKKIAFSDKLGRYGKPMHHANDICLFGKSVYVSMFSRTGNYSENGIFDGVVLEYDVETYEPRGAVLQGLWMPHNICHIGGDLVVLDSLPGYLRKGNAQIVGEFPGFTRGLDFDGRLFYIGQSRNRNFSKCLGISNNIAIDAAIVLFDERTKVSRSMQLPPQISEIHSIALL